MSVFRQRRFGLLLLAVFISAMLVWRPWVGLELQARGLNFGVDIAGGSRVVLQLDVSRTTMETSTDNWDSAAASISAGTISKLQARTDPYGLLGFRFRTFGENKLLCETIQLNDRTKRLLTAQGKLEVFAENRLAITDKDIETFSAPVLLGQVAGSVYSSIHVKYTEEAEAIIDTAFDTPTRAGVIYLDRPSDAILVFGEGILNGVSDMSYDNSGRMFFCTTKDIFTSAELRYPLLVSAVGTSAEGLSPEVLRYLENQVGTKSRIIFLGAMENFADVVEKIPGFYRLENVSRLEDEHVDKWIKRACGVISNFSGTWGVGQQRIVIEGDLQEARDIRAILSNKLLAGLSIVPGETEVRVGLGSEFVKEVLVAGAVALAGMFLLVYFRYRRWKIGLAVIGIVMCEFVIALGAVSALGLVIGLPELGGLLLVIGTCIDHLLIVTDAMLKEGTPQTGSVSVGWRASRALAIIYAAMFVIVVAMIPIGLLGFAMIRGFIMITISGTILALLFTRPFYAKILDAISTS